MKKIKYLLPIAFITLLTSCADFFQPRVPMDFDSASGSLDDLIVEKKKGGKLGTPSQLSVSKNADSGVISLLWTAVPNAVAYRIEYAVISPNDSGIYPEFIPEEQFSVLEDSWYGLNYKHNITETSLDDYENRYEKRYFYKISAVNTREGYDDGDPTPSNIYGTLFAPPENVNATAGESEKYINVSWDFVDGAQKYKILRSESESGAGAGYIATVLGNKNSYQDVISDANKGKDFYYMVYAVNRDGRESISSSIALGYSLVPGAPKSPSGVKIQEGKGRGDSTTEISLTWDNVQSEGEVKYNVFRQSSKDTSLTRVGKELTTNQFTDKKNLEPGVYYSYLVQTSVIDSETGGILKSAFSKPVEGFILSAPGNINAKKVEGGVRLTWDKAIGNTEEQESYSYKIFTSDELSGPYKEQTVLKNTEANVGSFKFFKIKTVNAKGVESEDSEIVAPAPYASTEVIVSRADYSFLGENPVANESGVYPVKISWKKPDKDNPYGYHIYRSQKEDSGYRKISEHVILASEGSDMFYLDTDDSLKPGKVYYYKVLSLNALEKGDNYSGSKYGWGALTQEQYLKQFNETIVSSQKKLTLMHKPGSTDKLGSETKQGTLSGQVYYNAAVQGLGAYIVMKYTNYVDFYIDPMKPSMGIKFKLNGNSDTSANMSSNGTMNGTITCEGMYPGSVNYNKIEIKAGAAGGGTYGVTPKGFASKDVPYSVLEEK